ncbi:hypothetical protein KY284_002438 [Solanum tuberosum]|nr:hypothetical protein KY284_002438 [Solanum tuberosum]
MEMFDYHGMFILIVTRQAQKPAIPMLQLQEQLLELTGGTSRKEIMLIIFVGVSLILPSILCLICVSCRVFLELNHRRQVAAATASLPSLAPMPMIVIEGLDESTIQSYPKVVLGESQRISGINVMICAICLGEYIAGETLRCIPECEHCFHVECVDKWLKINSSCPVCRNSLHS